jgi:hypothetical protein
VGGLPSGLILLGLAGQRKVGVPIDLRDAPIRRGDEQAVLAGPFVPTGRLFD